jgi:hypothetical protein
MGELIQQKADQKRQTYQQKCYQTCRDQESKRAIQASYPGVKSLQANHVSYSNSPPIEKIAFAANHR